MDCACTLEGADMMERITAWREISTQAISRRLEAGQVTSVYPPDQELFARLQDLIAAEAVCCSFLKFTIHSGADETIVRLNYPEEARGLVEAILAPEDGRHEPV